ncbi:MAG TPA: acetylglutamate kinase [Candidatus Thermoplasmatota archaeon]|nr:acetylglutamate kinase [Candidatus Thermoplasmatota archaeon]
MSTKIVVPEEKGRMKGIAVVKLGGRPLETAEGRARLAEALATLVASDVRLVVVHGGGAQITAALEREGVKPTFARGLRVTDARTLEVVETVLTRLGKDLAHALTRAGAPAVGLTGRDGNLLAGAVKDPELGLVGSVARVDAEVLRHFAFNGLTPVVAPIAVTPEGGALNCNADEAASAVAAAMGARHLVLATDVDGVRDATGAIAPTLSAAAARKLIADGVATGGMIPKIENALAALDSGVKRVHVVNGSDPAALARLFAGESVGTTLEA